MIYREQQENKRKHNTKQEKTQHKTREQEKHKTSPVPGHSINLRNFVSKKFVRGMVMSVASYP